VDRRGGDSGFPNAAMSNWFYTWEKERRRLGGIRNIKKRVTHLSEAREGPIET